LCDAWSFAVIAAEIGRLVKQKSLTPPLAQCSDFAAWQNSLADGNEPAQTLPDAIEFGGGDALGWCPVEVDTVPDPEPWLGAAWRVLVARLSSGAPVGWVRALRPYAELNDCVGLLAAPLVVMDPVPADQPFAELVATTARNLAQPFEHLRLPTEGGHLRFGFRFTFATHSAARLLRVRDHVDRFAVQLSALWGTEGPIEVGLQFDEQRVDRASAERLAERLTTFLAAARRAPRTAIDVLPVVGPRERAALATLSRGPALQRTRNRGLHDFLFDICAQQPDAIAVEDQTVQITYGGLVAFASRWAWTLRSHGVGLESAVGLCLEPSARTIGAIFAVLEAGGAYVPLDARLPRERLQQFVAAAGIRVLLVEKATQSRAPDVPLVIRIDCDPPNAPPSTRPPRLFDMAGAAYLLFTSGSSGVPKPVVVEHRQIVAYVTGLLAHVDILAPRAALISTLAADLGHTYLFGTLAAGGRLIVAAWTNSFDPDGLAADLARRPIDALKIVPSHLEALLGAARPKALLPRKVLILGGDVCSWALVERVRSLVPGVVVWNHYGPTEATVGVLAGPLGASETAPPALGTPLPGETVHLLDPLGDLVPVEVPGEIYLSGAGVARGYAGRPASTAELFLPDPFGEPGARRYRTGDRARWRADGRVGFIGRVDEQTKMRGFRVEPSEVAAVLRAQPGIAEALVRPIGHGATRYLAAYVVPDVSYYAGSLSTLAGEHVRGWVNVFSETHDVLKPRLGETFEPFGWNSSYTDHPLPMADVREQVERTVERISALRGSRILEIGCGTGLLLFPLAAQCTRFVGTDPSPAMLCYIQGVLESLPELTGRVELLERHAIDTNGLEPASFDVVVLNSVIQYFPSVEYLVEVLTRVTRLVRPNGRIFVGDVRNLRLLDAFHASVQLFRAGDGESTRQIAEQSARQRSREAELLIDPDFFTTIHGRVPGVTGAEVYMKGGCSDNELTRFRYDAVLYVGGGQAESVSFVDWCGAEYDLARLDAVLAAVDRLALTGIPNGRVGRDVQLVEMLRDPDGPPTAEGLRKALDSQSESKVQPVDPEALTMAARRSGHRVRLRWAPAGQEAQFEAVFARTQLGLVAPSFTPRGLALFAYANAPLLDKLAAQIVPSLDEAIHRALPKYMHPSAYTLLAGLPVTPNGKVDTDALPIPPHTLPDLARTYLVPRTPVEQQIAEVWREVLQLERIGVHDDFFKLGGHSLLATQVVARLRRLFDVTLPLRAFFNGPPTVERLATLLTADSARGAAPLSRRGDGGGAVALSHAQARYLLEADPTHPVFNVPFAFYVEGALDIDALRRGLDEIARRHSVWRTVFEGDRGGRQRVVDNIDFALREINLGMLDADDQGGAVRRIAGQAALTRFDLAVSPPVRGTLMSLGPNRHALSLVVHHIVHDGWSTGIFCRELTALYAAFHAGQPSPLPELPLQYTDYAAWQSDWLRGAVLAEQVSYWVDRLHGRPLELALPTEQPRPLAQTWLGSGIGVALGARATEAVRRLARDQDTPLFVPLFTGFVALLYVVTGQDDIGIGTPIANRTHSELEQLLGCFINFLVLQTDLRGNPTFLELMARVRKTCVDAYEHQDAPFRKLIEALLPNRSLARPPLFQVMFELANQPGSRRLMLSDVALTAFEFEHGTSEFELNLILQEDSMAGEAGQPVGITGWLLYRTDLFSETSATALFAAYRRLIEAAAANPYRRLSDFVAESPKWPAPWTDIDH
jgi:amino acid adenylation domain-containing protein